MELLYIYTAETQKNHTGNFDIFIDFQRPYSCGSFPDNFLDSSLKLSFQFFNLIEAGDSSGTIDDILFEIRN